MHLEYQCNNSLTPLALSFVLQALLLKSMGPAGGEEETAKKQKPGDIVVGYGLELLQEDNNVLNRDSAHDCIIGTWKRACGAEEHTAGGVNQRVCLDLLQDCWQGFCKRL